MSYDGSHVLWVINQIAETSGRTEKEKLISEHISDPHFRKVLMLALNPFTTYGISKSGIPEVSEIATGELKETHPAWTLLVALSSRTYTGNDAVSKVAGTLRGLSADSQELFRRVLGKDLRAGFTAKSVNRVEKGMIPTFEVMLAHKFEAKRIKQWPAVAEPKLDGVRVLGFVDAYAGTVTFYSRSGREYPGFNHLVQPIIDAWKAVKADLTKDRFGAALNYAIEAFNDGQFILEGEVISGSFNETVSSVRKKDAQAEDAEFHAFDLVPISLFENNEKATKATYLERRTALEGMIPLTAKGMLRVTPRYFVNSEEECQAYYEKFRARNLEGAIIKPREGKYERKRSHAWLKIKAADTEDLRVIGAFEGEGKYVGMLGGLIVSRPHNGAHVEVKVGGGFSDQQRKEFWDAYKSELEKTFAPGVAGVIHNRLCEVEYHEVTPDGSLRHPRFLRWRDDKDGEQEQAA